MSYIGNPPAEAYTNTVKDTFSGDGSTTAFTMSQISLTNDVRVVVENVVQDPTVAYSCAGTTLTFTSAPPTGTNNIYVVHLGPAVMTALPPAEIAQATTFNSNVSVGGNLTVDTNTLYVDSTNNNVGINTSSPSSFNGGANNLVVGSGSGSEGMTIYADSASNSAIFFADGTSGATTYTGQINYLHASDAMSFHTNGGTEHMRIDSSGNLLVGKTASSINNDGFQAHNTGYIGSTNSGASTAYFNRKTNDGDIVNFQKDGTTVGSIGVTDGDNLVISSTATDHAGLKFNNTAMGAYVNGASSDGTMDIGTYVVRFKDLYLSGGVYLGGTGAANHLDDYEEGTWTPSFDGLTNTPTFHNHSGKYTKIGNLVILQYFCQVNTTTNPTFSNNNATLYISGVPFAASGSGYTGSQGSVNAQSWSWNGTNNNQNVTGQVAASVANSKLFFNVTANGGNRGDVSNVSVTSSGPIIEATVMYRTT